MLIARATNDWPWADRNDPHNEVPAGASQASHKSAEQS